MNRAVDNDGDVEMTLPQPLFEFIKTPKLSAWDQPSLVAWVRERRLYEQRVTERCAATGEIPEAVMVSAKSSMDPLLLERLAKYIFPQPVDQIDEEDLTVRIHKRTGKLRNLHIPDVAELFHGLRMNLAEPDVEARVVAYFGDFDKSITENGIQEMLGSGDTKSPTYRDRMKHRCELLIEHLASDVVKLEVSRLVKLKYRDAKTDELKLFDIILDRAREQQHHHDMAQEAAGPRQREPKKNNKSNKNHNQAAKASENGHVNVTMAATTKRRPPPKTGCWLCKGPHWLEDCSASEAEKAAARLEMKKVREAKVVKSKTVHVAGRELHRSMVVVNDVFELPFLADTGADCNIIPRHVVEEMRELGVVPTLRQLPRAVKVEVAGGQYIRCSHSCVVDLKIGTRAGNINVRGVECLVMGYKRTVHFQNQMCAAFADMLYESVIVWIDDVVLFAHDEEGYLDELRKFFTIQRDYNLKLSATKNKVFVRSVTSCGRGIDGEAINQDRERVATLVALPLPTNAGELQYFLCAANWMRDTFVNFARVVEPLQIKLDTALKGKSRRAREAAKVPLTWTPDEENDYRDAIGLLATPARLYFPEEESQKEGYPIIRACTDLEYVLCRAKGFKMYCDHANLINIFDPVAELKQHVRGKLQRWSMGLVGLNYEVEHIQGSANVEGGEDACTAAESVLRPLQAATFDWPTQDDVVIINGKVWTPAQDKELVKRVLITAHCGIEGHRGADVMAVQLREHYHIAGLDNLSRRFVKDCLLCKPVKGRNLIQRPRGEHTTATHRNEVLHLDFHHMGEAYEGCEMKYILMLKDELTHYCELVACPLNRDALQVIRYYLLPLVQAKLNQTPVASLGYKSPMELFTALHPITVLDTLVKPVTSS
ncbi:hypothetical protein P43SY_000242 [Pythium insidiosum]|uniref:Reverse transcriptase n=1 Tax=Pythium insidiosum TaxID=114742 RepID=A0AAD5LLR2_PYTIN|nr:hypothetical protein P43SY_000242 [Pythium insidiosum]